MSNEADSTAASATRSDPNEAIVKEQSPSAPSAFETSDAALSGWRFWFTMAGLYLGFFLVTLEMTIVSTALVAISNELRDFEHATWVVNAYFLTWSGFLVLWSQFSHTFGRKPSLLVAVGLFVAFSAGCAAAQSAVQLIILRAFQGLAGAGVFSMAIVIISEAIPPSALPRYTAFMAVVSVISFSTGPLIGGAIAANTTWRWIFILNIPAGIVVFILDLVALPRGFPYHRKAKSHHNYSRLASLKQLDVLGGIFFLCASIFIVTALQEASSSYAWGSALIICLVVFSILFMIGFVLWERRITQGSSTIIPVMTWKFVKRRPLGIFASSFLIGVPFTTTLIQIPQRFQVVNGLTSLEAGIRLLPYIMMVPFGTVVGSIISGKVKRRPTYGMLLGASLQLAAVICFATVPLSGSRRSALPTSQYGFQILIGLGNGISYTVNFNGMPYALDGQKNLIAPAMGTNTQFRYLGGAIGLGVVTAALNGYVRSQLSDVLTPSDITAILQSSGMISTLSVEAQTRVLQVFTSGFLLQWRIMCGFVGLQIVANILAY